MWFKWLVPEWLSSNLTNTPQGPTHSTLSTAAFLQGPSDTGLGCHHKAENCRCCHLKWESALFHLIKSGFFQLLCFNQLSEFSVKDKNKCFLWNPDQTLWSKQISSLMKPQWVENIALTLHSKTSGGTQNPEKTSVPMAVLHIGTVLWLTIVCQVFSCVQKCQWHKHIENPVDSRRTRVSCTSGPKWINFRIDSPGHRTHP